MGDSFIGGAPTPPTLTTLPPTGALPAGVWVAVALGAWLVLVTVIVAVRHCLKDKVRLH